MCGGLPDVTIVNGAWPTSCADTAAGESCTAVCNNGKQNPASNPGRVTHYAVHGSRTMYSVHQATLQTSIQIHFLCNFCHCTDACKSEIENSNQAILHCECEPNADEDKMCACQRLLLFACPQAMAVKWSQAFAAQRPTALLSGTKQHCKGLAARVGDDGGGGI